MASVSKCDKCGNVGEHGGFKFIEIFCESPLGFKGHPEYSIEVCPECANKFLEMFNKDGSEQRETI